MSNITKTNGANIVNIKVPNLNSAEYAQGLEQVFDNINNNFQTLANHEFIKGDTGNSVFIKNELIYNSLSGTYTEIGEQIKNTIYNKEDVLPSITINNNVFHWDDNLKSSSINMLVSVDNHETNYTENYVSSLYFVFLDGRFINTNQNFKLGDIPAENYEDIEDLSCIIVYENGKFTKLSNAFPTIYYEKGYGLCWKLNGGKTGMPVKGLPGNDGKNAQITIVKAETQSNIVSGEFKKVNITHIFEPISGMISVSEIEDLKEYSGISALVLCEIDNNMDYYFGTLQVENEILLANIFTGKNIISNATLEGFNNAMKSINLSSDGDSASTIKGLFIPMTSNTSDSTPVHLLTASSITGEQNTEVTDPYKNDIIFSPISDYDSITNNDNVSVKKYLYIRANYKNIDAIKTAYGINVNSNNPIAKYNGILKYKLDSIVTTNSTDFNLPARDNVLVSDKMINLLTGTPFNKLYESFTNNIKQKLDKGLYKWVLCIDKHTFDVDELLNETNSELSYPKYFNTIYTTELTPTASSTIYWFDSYGDTTKNINNVNYTIVPGFSEPEDKFAFIKFVPVHDNDLPINVDTTLNLNYNVNITGDKNIYNKSLTVHGGVNCDDLSVYRLTATGEIKNIYTKDTIIGDSGINLIKNDNGTYNFYVEPDGDIVSRKSLRANCINLTGLIEDSGNISSIKSDQDNSVITNNIVATDTANIKNIVLSQNSNNDAKVEVKLINDKPTIIGTGIDSIELSGENAIVTTNIPVNINDNNNLIVSNQSKESERLYYKGLQSEHANDGIKDCSFESTRNFNLQDFFETNYIDGKSNINTTYEEITYTGGCISSLSGPDTDNRYTYICAGGGTSEVNSVSASTPSITTNYITNNYCQKIELNRTLDTEWLLELQKNKSLTLNFTKDMQMHIGVFGRKNDRGSWPVLMDTSYIELKLFFIDGANNIQHLATSNKYKFDYTVLDAENCSISTNPWIGFNNSGNNISKSTDFTWRYYAYKVRPKDITISESMTSLLISLINKYAGKGTLYVVPTGYIEVKSQKLHKNNVLKRIYATPLRSINTSNLTAGTTLKRVTTGVNVNFTANSGSNIKIKYTHKTTSTGIIANDDVKITTVCDDGIVMRAGKYLFGLGYAKCVNHNRSGGTGEPDFNMVGYKNETTLDGKDIIWNPSNEITSEKDSPNKGKAFLDNQPVLFYYDASVIKNYSDIDDKLLTTTNDGYAKRVDSIPLKDIFECIRYLREDKHYQFGI